MADKPVMPAVPDYLKKYVMTPDQVGDADSAAAASMSVPRVSLRAKKFRWMELGEEVKAEAESFCVILAVEPFGQKMVKTYYEGEYNPGDTTPPTCSSSDGIRPDSWVTTPQNAVCSGCRHNVFGSATSRKGKPAKACRDSKRLWITPPEALEGTVYGLQVPVTSLGNLSELGVKIKATGLPMSAAVVKMSMEEEESYPIIKFDVAGWLHEQFVPIALDRNVKKDWAGALKHENPPVTAAIQDKGVAGTLAAPQQANTSAPQPQSQPEPSKLAPDGAIEGTATKVEAKPAPNVDAALSTWG